MTSEVVGRSGQTVTELAVANLRRIRKRRALTAPQLAARCAEHGAGDITANVLANIEAGRRQVNLNQLAALALALDVAPVHLLAGEDQEQVDVSDSLVLEGGSWTAWLTGQAPLPQQDENAFWAYCLERPSADGTARALIDMARQRAMATTHKVVADLQEHADQQIADLQREMLAALDVIEKVTRGGDIEAACNAISRLRGQLATTPA